MSDDIDKRVGRLEDVTEQLGISVAKIEGAVSIIADSTKSIQEATQAIARVDEKHNALTIDTQRNWEAIERLANAHSQLRQEHDECAPYIDNIKGVTENIKKVITWGVTIACLSGIYYAIQQALQNGQ